MKTVSVRLEDAEKELLQKYAEENDLTMSQVLRKAMKEFLQKENKE